jgi:hypothetical protein
MFSELNTRNISITTNPPLNLLSPNSSNESSHSNFPNSLFSNTAAIYISQPSVKTLNIEYFYPNISSLWTDAILFSAEKENRIYYRNIYIFTNRLKKFASIKKKNMIAIRNIINICLKGEIEL